MKNLRITVNGTAYDVQVEELGETAGAPVSAPKAAPAKPASPAPKAASSSGEAVNAPMAGTISSVNVSAGQSVKKGDTLVVLEAMKLENQIMAPRDCTVESVAVSKGASVETGAALVYIK